MKEQNGNEHTEKMMKRKKGASKEKRFYLITSISAAAVLLAVIVIAVAVSSLDSGNVPATGNNSSNLIQNSSGNMDQVGDNDNEPVVNTPEGMIMPLQSVSIVNDYGFYHNKTLNNYYEHKGVDFTAEVGTEVFAVEAGIIETIYRDDVLTGTEITIDHGDGIKTVYRFVNVAEGVSVGMEVGKGDVIATIAEATGNEYKDGAHLHFEIKKNGETVDPATYLTFEEK